MAIQISRGFPEIIRVYNTLDFCNKAKKGFLDYLEWVIIVLYFYYSPSLLNFYFATWMRQFPFSELLRYRGGVVLQMGNLMRIPNHLDIQKTAVRVRVNPVLHIFHFACLNISIPMGRMDSPGVLSCMGMGYVSSTIYLRTRFLQN